MIARFFAVFSLVFLMIVPAPVSLQAATEESKTGGRFMLRSHTGKIVTDQDFHGKFMLIYFGYTYCPDICPTSLQTLTHALDLLKDDGKEFQPIFITVDPKRDTVQVMRDYVGAFHPRMVGLTGPQAMIDDVAKKYRVKFARVSEKGALNDDYTVDHTASVFLMGPNGDYLKRFPYNTTAQQMAAALRDLLKKAKTK